MLIIGDRLEINSDYMLDKTIVLEDMANSVELKISHQSDI